MSPLTYFSYLNFGTRSQRDINYSQSVRLSVRIEISEQGGWDPLTEEFPTDLGEEVERAFANVHLALEIAGGKGWEGVYKARVYLNLRGRGMEGWDEHLGCVVTSLNKWCPNHAPLLTGLEVKGLFKDMRIEIEAVEYLG